MAAAKGRAPADPAVTMAAPSAQPIKSGTFVPAGARAVGSFLPKLTQKAFERYGFPAAAILTDWSRIVGPELAAFTRPERLKWPKGTAAVNEDGTADPGNGPSGGTLILRVDGPRAIEIQYKATQLVERINAYFGFRAIAELRILQAPLPRHANPVNRWAPSRSKASPPKPRDVIGQTDTRDDNPLAIALARLGTAVSARRQSARGD